MNFIGGFLTALILISILIEWRTGLFKSMFEYYKFEINKKFESWMKEKDS